MAWCKVFFKLEWSRSSILVFSKSLIRPTWGKPLTRWSRAAISRSAIYVLASAPLCQVPAFRFAKRCQSAVGVSDMTTNVLINVTELDATSSSVATNTHGRWDPTIRPARESPGHWDCYTKCSRLLSNQQVSVSRNSGNREIDRNWAMTFALYIVHRFQDSKEDIN